MLTCRYLMKSYTAAQQGSQTTGSVAYLSEKNFDKCVVTRELSPDTLVAAYKHRAARSVSSLA